MMVETDFTNDDLNGDLMVLADELPSGVTEGPVTLVVEGANVPALLEFRTATFCEHCGPRTFAVFHVR